MSSYKNYNNILLKFHSGELDMYDYYNVYSHIRALYLLNKSKEYVNRHYPNIPYIDLYLNDDIVRERTLSVGYNSYEMEKAYSIDEILDIVHNDKYAINSIVIDNSSDSHVSKWVDTFISNGFKVDMNNNSYMVILRKGR